MELKNKNLVSCSSDKSIIFYFKNNSIYEQDYEICYSEKVDYANHNICFYNLDGKKIKS